MKLNKMHGALTREQAENAVKIASELFCENGIYQTKMTDVAAECGVGVGALCSCFDTKTDLAVKAGAYMWKLESDTIRSQLVSSAEYEKMTGIEQFRMILSQFPRAYNERPTRLRFVYCFDAYVQQEAVPKERLKEYDSAVLDFRPICYAAFEKGWADGTIRRDIDAPGFYAATMHTMLNLSVKFSMGELFESDSSEFFAYELNMLIEMFVSYLRPIHAQGSGDAE